MDLIYTFRKHSRHWAIKLFCFGVMQWSSFAFWPECEYCCCEGVLVLSRYMVPSSLTHPIVAGPSVTALARSGGAPIKQ